MDQKKVIELKNRLQKEAVSAVIENKGRGTVLATMGFGKTFVFYKFIYKLWSLGWIQKGSHWIYYGEVSNREYTIKEEAIAFYKHYGLKPFEDFNIEYRCYQSGLKNSDGACYDEIDVAMSNVGHNIIKNNTAKYCLGLTGTESANLNVFAIDEELKNKARQSDKDTKKGKITEFINKGQLLEVLCPIVYKYTFSQALNDGLLTPLRTWVINHNLDSVHNNIKTWKSYDNLGTEYDFYDKRRKKMMSPRTNVFLRKAFGRQMSNFIQILPSKARVGKRLIDLLDHKKKVVFGVKKDLLYKITDNVCESNNIEEYLDRFKKGDINTLASAKMIGRGLTLDKDCDTAIVVSYFSTSTDFLQKISRITRRQEGKEWANLFIIRTNFTMETKWFENMNKIRNDRGRVVEKIDLNIQEFISSENLMLKNFKLNGI